MLKDKIKEKLLKYPILYSLVQYIYLIKDTIIKYIRNFLLFPFLLIPIKNNKIVICSYYGKGYGDNGKYIVEEIIKQGMAAGKPVIASNVIGLSEVVIDAGILFEKGNFNELVSIIINLIKKNNDYVKVSESCLTRANSFSIEKMVSHYTKEYLEFEK